MPDPQPSPEASASRSVTVDEHEFPPFGSVDGGETNDLLTPPAPPVSSARSSSTWLDHGVIAATGLWSWLSQPRVRLMVMGAILLVFAGLVVTGSAWTAPLVIAGLAMVVIAWCGPRLDGRLVLQWGNSGAKLEFRAGITPPDHLPEQPAPTTSTSDFVNAESEASNVLRDEPHTVEVDIAELRALILLAKAGHLHNVPSEQASNGSPETRT
jgi:hypothetical protein